MYNVKWCLHQTRQNIFIQGILLTDHTLIDLHKKTWDTHKVVTRGR